MLFPCNPHNYFSDDPEELAKAEAWDIEYAKKYTELSDDDLENVYTEFKKTHQDLILTCYYEQGAHFDNNFIEEWSLLKNEVMRRRSAKNIVTIELQPTAIVALSRDFTFSRNNQLYKVRISHPMTMIRKIDPEDTLKTEIKTYFGITEDIKFEYKPDVKDTLMNKEGAKPSPIGEGLLITRELLESEIIMPNNIRKSLEKLAAKSLIVEYNKRTSKSDIFDKLSKFCDKIYSLLHNKENTKLTKWVGYRYTWIGRLSSYFDSKSKTQYYRDFHQVGYLGITCFAQEVASASALLSYDLAKLESIGAIEGNLTKMNVLRLADCVGDGKLRYIVYCYPLLKGPVIPIMDKLCDYAISEGADNCKSVSKDEPNIIDIDNKWERRIKFGENGELIQYNALPGTPEDPSFLKYQKDKGFVGFNSILDKEIHDSKSKKKSKKKQKNLKNSGYKIIAKPSKPDFNKIFDTKKKKKVK